MAERQRRTERSSAKGAAGAVAVDSADAMDKFKSLARQLLRVPRDELAAEQEKAAETKAQKRRHTS